ncbi:TIGR03767 family metallophosphoesterase [Nocardioides aestuarii]|uniref:Metallophosphoesterase n=1 Tax=Nocardioides aestuarii TaxID=252231 RepID=A0ABW4TFZ9_9ACTN
MDLTRRHLFRTAGAASAVAALSGAAVAGTGLAARAVAGPRAVTGRLTTLEKTFRISRPNDRGWSRVVAGPGEPHVVRAGLGAPAQRGRASRRTPLLAFAQLSDVHVLDAQSPMRFEREEGVSSSAYRPQEMLTAHVAESMVRRLNRIGVGPVSGVPLALAIQTGDNSDNSQYNEIRWNIDLLDGGEITPDSGDLSRWEGVMDDDPDFYDRYFWHPDGPPAGKKKDVPMTKHGFPRIPGLLDRARAPFQATGLAMPWYAVFGNHDQLVQGNFQQIALWQEKAVSGEKAYKTTVREVTPDPDRRLLSRADTIEEHFTTTGSPVGHGFTEDNRSSGLGYYTFDQGDVRFVVMDTVNENGGQDGSLPESQFAWLEAQLAAATDKLVVAASHHTSWSMGNDRLQTGAEPRVLGPAVVDLLLAHPNVVAWVNGHTHDNQVRPHAREGGGFWEINTASHIDWPQQSRLIELMDNQDGSLSIFCTMVDHAARRRAKTYDGVLRLASLSRQLSANDWQLHTESRGKKNARNVELLLPMPALV